MLNNLLMERLKKNEQMKNIYKTQIKKTVVLNNSPALQRHPPTPDNRQSVFLKEQEPVKVLLPDKTQINLQPEVQLTETDLMKAIQRKKMTEKKLAGVSPAVRAKQMREAKAQKAKHERETKKRFMQMEKQKKQYKKDLIERLKEKFPDDGDEDVKKNKIKNDISDMKDILFDILELKRNKIDGEEADDEEDSGGDWEDVEIKNKQNKK